MAPAELEGLGVFFFAFGRLINEVKQLMNKQENKQVSFSDVTRNLHARRLNTFGKIENVKIPSISASTQEYLTKYFKWF